MGAIDRDLARRNEIIWGNEVLKQAFMKQTGNAIFAMTTSLPGSSYVPHANHAFHA